MQRAAVEAAVRRAARVAALADLALGARGRRAQTFAGSPGAIRGIGSPYSAPPAVIRSTTSVELEHAGQDQLGVERRERGLQPGRAHRRLLERHLLLVARVRRVVGGDALDHAAAQRRRSAPAVGLGAQRRVHLEAAVERADGLVGQRQVVRRRLAADARPGRVACAERLHRLDAARGAGSARARPRSSASAASRATIVDSDSDGIPASPSRAETAPSCITPSPESAGSSSCSAITPPHSRWYWSALRSIPARHDRLAVVGEAERAGVAQRRHLGQLAARAGRA